MSTRPKIAIVYSLDSAPTAIVSEIARHTSEALRNYNVDVEEFGVMKATRLFFHLSLFFKKFDGIFYFGHGWKTELFGQLPFGYVTPLILVGDKIRTKIIYAVACVAGQQLGPWLARNRVVDAAIMNTNYTYVAIPSKEHNYLNDFIDIFTTPPRILGGGGTSGEAFNSMLKKIRMYYDLYERNLKNWANADFYMYALKSNMDYKLFGDPSATLFD